MIRLKDFPGSGILPESCRFPRIVGGWFGHARMIPLFWAKILALHRRQKNASFVLRGRSQFIQNRAGQVIGFLERVHIAHGKASVAGWALAEDVALCVGEQRQRKSARILRRDVSIGEGVPQEVGFSVSLLVNFSELSNRPLLWLTMSCQAGDSPPHSIPIEIPFLRLQMALVSWRCVVDMVLALPAMSRWYVTGDVRARMHAKKRLGLGMLPANALEMPSGIFKTAKGQLSADHMQSSPRITIIMPVFNAFECLERALECIVRHTKGPKRLILIEDGSTDARVRPFLRAWASEHDLGKEIFLIEHTQNRGFVRAVNAGLEQALAYQGADEGPIVLLNSDTFVPLGWDVRLIRPLLEDDRFASATPMSNQAEIFSVPVICGAVKLRPGQAEAIDAVAQTLCPQTTQVSAPVGVGFCMALSRKWLVQEPSFDEAFGRGYGEEVDWCQKIFRRGGRHVAVTNLFVEHQGSMSFGEDVKQELVARHNLVISQKHPFLDTEVQSFIATDPLVAVRLALGLSWAASMEEGREIPVYLAHSLGGGAELYLKDRLKRRLASGRAAVVVRVGGIRQWRLELHTPQGVTCADTEDTALVERLISILPRRRMIYSCGVGAHDPIGIPKFLLALGKGEAHQIEILFHDYFPLSPAYTLLNQDGVHGVCSSGRVGDRAWCEAWKPLAQTAQTLRVFSRNSAGYVRAAWPELSERIVVSPHRLLNPPAPAALPDPSAAITIGVLGNINYHKGAMVLQELGGLLAASTLCERSMIVVGCVDPTYPMPPGVRIHGSYQQAEISDLAKRYGITHWLIPSIWPETFSYTTHEALTTRLPVLAFDIGAQGEAVRLAKNGILVPHESRIRPPGQSRAMFQRTQARVAARNVIDAVTRAHARRRARFCSSAQYGGHSVESAVA